MAAGRLDALAAASEHPAAVCVQAEAALAAGRLASLAPRDTSDAESDAESDSESDAETDTATIAYNDDVPT